MNNPLAQANADIREQMALQYERRRLRQRSSRPIRTIDTLLGDLEALHLAGRKRVPEAMQPELSALTRMLPPELRQDLPSRVTISHLMDRLYTIQDRLFEREGARLQIEEHEEASAAASPEGLSQAS